MAVTFKFTLPPEMIAKMKAKLSARQIRGAMFQATKRSQDAVKRIVVDSVVDQSSLNRKAANKAVRSVPPHGDVPVGEVIVSGKAIPLINFKPRVSKRGGVTVIVSKDAKAIHLAHAFKATVRAGGDDTHTGIFTRKRTAYSNHRTKHGKLMRTPRGFAWRLPIQQALGPGAADLVNKAAVEETVRERISGIVEKNVQSQIDRFLKVK